LNPPVEFAARVRSASAALPFAFGSVPGPAHRPSTQNARPAVGGRVFPPAPHPFPARCQVQSGRADDLARRFSVSRPHAAGGAPFFWFTAHLASVTPQRSRGTSHGGLRLTVPIKSIVLPQPGHCGGGRESGLTRAGTRQSSSASMRSHFAREAPAIQP